MPNVISIIIPVYREEAIINTALCRLQPVISAMPVEIIVVDGDPDQTTIKTITDPSPGVRPMVGPKGRGPQMNAGAGEARGSLLVFLHVDTRLPDNALRHVLSACACDDIAGGAFDLEIASPKPIYRWIEKAASVRSRITRMPYGDQALFMKTRCFHDLGGYRNIPLMEDVDLMQRLKRAGGKIKLIREPVRTSPRRWETEGPIYCTMRNTILSCLFFAGAAPEKLARYYPRNP